MKILTTILGLLTLSGTVYAAPAIHVGERDIQAVIKATEPHATIVADRDRIVEVTETITIDKPVTLVGLNARLKSGLELTPILRVLAENVRIRDFHLVGNADSVPQEGRAPLIEVRRGRFIIENGVTDNSSKDGIMVTPVPEYGDIEHGLIRNITSNGTVRDTVSIGGAGELGLFVRHVLVENIRAYNSSMRGPAEVSDGSEYITVRDIYAEGCRYGVDIQDHNLKGQVNRHIIIDGLFVKNSQMAVRTGNHDFGHDGLTIRNVTGTEWAVGKEPPFRLDNTSNVHVENVRLYRCPIGPCMQIRNSDNVTLRDISFIDGGHDGPALLIEDGQHVLIDNVIISGAQQPQFGVVYRVISDEKFGGLRIFNVLAPDVRETGIVLENLSKSGQLETYQLGGNMGTVSTDIPAPTRNW
jgi:hypothetical protein